MPKLHELLAVEGQLKGQAEKVRGETQDTFHKKRHLFEQKLVTFLAVAEGAQPQVEQQSDLQSTVRGELAWLSGILGKSYDTTLRVCDGNTVAKGDIILDDGITILKDVPATALLDVEKRLRELHQLLDAIATLDPAKGFTADDTFKVKGVYISRPHRGPRTKKQEEPIVLLEPTKEHPGQAQLITRDVVVGNTTTQEWSGLITPAEKTVLLERVERLQRGVKQARSRANEVEVPDARPLGQAIFDYLLG